MKTIHLITAIFLATIINMLSSCFVRAQHTVNSTGSTLKASDVSYAYSVGEVSGFSVKPYCSYTQGVVQPAHFLCAPVKYQYNDLYELLFYPNPITDLLIIETDYPDFVAYKVFATDGRMVQSGKFSYSPISLKNLPAGFYLIQLLSSDNKIKKSFKILKTAS
jgi:hypothetical protein